MADELIKDLERLKRDYTELEERLRQAEDTLQANKQQIEAPVRESAEKDDVIR